MFAVDHLMFGNHAMTNVQIVIIVNKTRYYHQIRAACIYLLPKMADSHSLFSSTSLYFSQQHPVLSSTSPVINCYVKEVCCRFNAFLDLTFKIKICS